MPRGAGWYLIGPLIAFALIGLLGTIFWRLGPHQEASREQDPPARRLVGDRSG